MADYPELTMKYFGAYLDRLTAYQAENDKFVRHFWPTDRLEARLKSIEDLGLTTKIIGKEVGDISDPVELDRRLMDAWAELRFISQLQREGFVKIEKVTKTVDFTAERDGQKYAFQVTRANRSLNDEAATRQNPEDRILRLHGELISKIHEKFSPVLNDFFWKRLEEKNGDLKEWKDTEYKRCIVIVTSDEKLQDSLVRHIACQQIRAAIHLLTKIHFEELIWLPDTGNGAWFIVGNHVAETTCFVDWGDNPSKPYRESDGVKREKLNFGDPLP